VLVALSAPGYAFSHPNKRVWFVDHDPSSSLSGIQWQHLPSNEAALAVRSAVRHSVEQYLAEAERVFASSPRIAARVRELKGVNVDVLYAPPRRPDLLLWEEPDDYVLCPLGAASGERRLLVLDAASHLARDVRVVIGAGAGQSDDAQALAAMIRDRGLEQRVTLIPSSSSDVEQAELFGRSLGVLDLDAAVGGGSCGRITLAASYARKAIITCTDSGAAAELVSDCANGLVVAPDALSLAAAIERLRSDRGLAKRLGEAAHEMLLQRDITWEHVADELIA
jgi:glycosyltransferase involved in cell wall biosynthesis